MQPQIHFCTSADGVHIGYAIYGERGRRPVLSMHVWTNVQDVSRGHPARTYFEELALDRQVVTFDRRGLGVSQREINDLSLEAQIADLGAVVDDAGLETFDMVGFADGAACAAGYAARHPERVSRLALSGAYSRGEEIARPEQTHSIATLIRENWPLARRTLASLFVDEDSIEAQRRFSDTLRHSVSAEIAARYLEYQNSLDVRKELAEVRTPTLILHRPRATMGWSAAAVSVAALIPGARLVALEDTGLLAIARALRKFFDEGQASERAGTLPSGTQATIRVPSGSVRTFAGGRYTVVRRLGEGAQKTVYLVHDTALDRHCALALLKTEAMDADGIFRIKREAQAMGSLTHPNIVVVYDVGEEAGRPYIVCEYIPGGDLQQELRRAAGPLPLDRALAIGQDVCRALAAAHQRGITHRDVKPGNIWLMEDGGAKLGDFGLALAIDRSRLTMAGTAMGTAAYMAPEQAQGQATDARTDLYSLGCLLYELATGRPPFLADDPIAVVSQHIHATPLQPSHYQANVPPRLERLILNLLAKAQGERPASAGEVLHELGEIAASK